MSGMFATEAMADPGSKPDVKEINLQLEAKPGTHLFD